MGTDKNDLKRMLDLCTLCGSCNSSCPVYDIELTEPYSPRGKINLIKEFTAGHITASDKMQELISVCIICGYCQNSCSKGVDFKSIFNGYLALTENIDSD